MGALRPDYVSFGTLLNNRLFRIPDYQRVYSWQSSHREDLFNHIEKIPLQGDEEHFMATIVVQRPGKERIGTDEYVISYVVDGQERLTTLVTLLKAIAKHQVIDPGLRAQLNALLIKLDDKLLLLQRNHDLGMFYERYMREGICSDPASAQTLADRELLRAIRDCENFVAEWNESVSLIDLVALLKNRPTFVLHQILNKRMAYTTFEVLNSRRLSIAIAWMRLISIA